MQNLCENNVVTPVFWNLFKTNAPIFAEGLYREGKQKYIDRKLIRLFQPENLKMIIIYGI